jgi:hypothetical protein
VAYSEEVVDQIKRQDFRSAVKEYFYALMGVKTGIYPTKEEIYEYMLRDHTCGILNIEIEPI